MPPAGKLPQGQVSEDSSIVYGRMLVYFHDKNISENCVIHDSANPYVTHSIPITPDGYFIGHMYNTPQITPYVSCNQYPVSLSGLSFPYMQPGSGYYLGDTTIRWTNSKNGVDDLGSMGRLAYRAGYRCDGCLVTSHTSDTIIGLLTVDVLQNMARKDFLEVKMADKISYKVDDNYNKTKEMFAPEFAKLTKQPAQVNATMRHAK